MIIVNIKVPSVGKIDLLKNFLYSIELCLKEKPFKKQQEWVPQATQKVSINLQLTSRHKITLDGLYENRLILMACQCH